VQYVMFSSGWTSGRDGLIICIDLGGCLYNYKSLMDLDLVSSGSQLLRSNRSDNQSTF